MIEALLDLPQHLRERLVAALQARLLPKRPSEAAIRSVLGGGFDVGRVREVLWAFDEMGLSGPSAARWIQSIAKVEARAPRMDLVWSGPEVAGLHARDTRRVYAELLGSAQRSLWLSTFVFFDGPRAFAPLARRMDEVAGLEVTLLLNIQRRRGDMAPSDHLVRRFAERFWSQEWPGRARPHVFYDPRSLDPDEPTGVLHAKAVIADDQTVFITSANLTDAALDRNIEIGLLVGDRTLATSLVTHLRALIERGLLSPLPVS